MRKCSQFATIILMVVLSIAAQELLAQGTIRGTVMDKALGESLMFTNVLVKDTDPLIGAQTDLDGNYEINIAAGTYALEVSYIGYQTNIISEIEVKDGEVTIIDFLMDEASAMLQEVVVVARTIDRTENALLALQRKASAIQDGISAQEISRYGSSNAAESMKRVTGASVVDGRYIYVRGLGDRYTSAQLNGQKLPSADPYRNSIQMDLIPANLLDNIVVSKTFTPDQLGTFTGGNVNVKTKAFPEEFTLSASISTSYNTQSSFVNDFLTQDGPNSIDFGFNNGYYDLPSIFTEDIDYKGKPQTYTDIVRSSSYISGRRDSLLAHTIDEAANGLNPQRVGSRKSVPMNYGASFSIGNQYNVGGNPLGVLVGLNYNKSYQFYQDGRFGFYELTDPNSDLNLDRKLTDSRGVEKATLGGLMNLSYKFAGSNKISFIALYNHIGGNDVRELAGEFPAIISGSGIFETRALRFQERQFLDYQLAGEHVFGENGIKLEWGASAVNITQESPDFRQFSNTYSVEDDGSRKYFISPAEFDLPFHFFRSLEDKSYTGTIDLTIPFAQEKSKANKIKVGGFFAQKDRTFIDNVFQVQLTPGSEDYTGDPSIFFGSENVGIISENPDRPNRRYNIGLFPLGFDKATKQNSHTGEEASAAAYAMATYDFGKLRVIGGLRAEQTNISVQSRDTTLAKGDIDQLDFLPAVNLVYRLRDNMNFRASGTQTIARPNIREIAPFTSFDFGGDLRIQGNPNLDRTLIQNYDFRWEWYPNPGEIFAASVYYKNFKNAIVKRFVTEAANPLLTFDNIDKATVFGLELEARKSLGFIAPALTNLKLITNVSLIQSVVDIPEQELAIIEEFNPEKGETRPFQGQSPFLLNAALNYSMPDNGLDILLAFNVFGRRLSIISQGGNPDVYEEPRPQLDFSISKKFDNNIAVKLSAKNLLNPDIKTTMNFKNKEYLITQYQTGLTLGASLSYSF